MKKIFSVLAIGLSAIVATSAHSATMVVGDGVFGADSVLRDTTNSREFLRLDLTSGYGFDAISMEFGMGGDFEGWGVASEANMDDLAASAGVTHGSDDPTQVTIAESLRDFFCPAGTCVNLSSSHEVARGLISDTILISGTPRQIAFTIGRRFNVTPHEVDFRTSGFASGSATNEEVWLTRSVAAVPLPAAGWLLIAGVGGLGLMKRRKKAA